MSKLVDAFKNYVKKSEAATAASRAEMEARGQVNPFLEEKPTEAELQQLIDLGGKEMTYPMIDYIKKWRVYYQKGVSYGKYELKKNGIYYCAFLNGEQVYLEIPPYELDDLEKVKAALDTRDRAEKEAIPLMKKLGLYDLVYESLECKRSSVYHRTPHYFRDEEKVALQKLKDKSPDTSKWEIRIERDMVSMLPEQRAYESRTEREWGYDRGDFVEIRTPNGRLEWGAMLRY